MWCPYRFPRVGESTQSSEDTSNEASQLDHVVAVAAALMHHIETKVVVELVSVSDQ